MISIAEAKKMVGEALDTMAEIRAYHIDDDEQYHFEYGTSAMSIQVYQDSDTNLKLINFRAGLAYNFDLDNISRQTALALLSFNWEMPLGSVSIPENDEVIWFEYNIPIDLITEDKLPLLIGVVAEVADALDENITNMVGGVRAID